MGTSLIVRNLDPRDKSWLKREARLSGVSMEEYVRRLIREKRANGETKPKLSEVFAHYFGEEHGIDIPVPQKYGYRPISFSEDDSE